MLLTMDLVTCAMLVTLTSAFVLDVAHPPIDTCMCVIRATYAFLETMHEAYPVLVDVPECFKFSGRFYEWQDSDASYELKAVQGHNAWLEKRVLKVSTPDHCIDTTLIPMIDESRKCNDYEAGDYACKLMNINNTLAKSHMSGKHDDAFAYNNIRDTCDGLSASRSNYSCKECSVQGAPGGDVCLNGTLLKYIYKVHQRLYKRPGACHSCDSKHYLGRAVDLHVPTNRTSNETVYRVNTMIDLCTKLGGWALDEKNHIHCEFRH